MGKNKIFATIPVHFEKDQEYLKTSFNGIAMLQEQMRSLIKSDNFFVVKNPYQDLNNIEIGNVLGKVVDIEKDGLHGVKLKFEVFNAIDAVLTGNRLKLQGYFRRQCKIVSYSDYELTCVSLTKFKI